ncbi:serine protease, partial [uncultured Rubinisphaera sp.]|uniref:S1C family serine protease n=1 Tax=uncultured Rubinisphaera sp. TaxID=1678686 RepID=UPI0030DB75A2
MIKNPFDTFQTLTVLFLLSMALVFPSHVSAEDQEEVIERVLKSVVRIDVIDSNGQAFKQGTGFCIEKGIIATNVHVLKDGSRFKVTRPDGKATVITGIWKYDVDRDIALAQLGDVEGNGNIPPLKIAPEDSIRLGTSIFAFGNPKGLNFSVSSGLISSLDRNIKELDPDMTGTGLQIDVSSAPGGSGGPIVNKHGEVVGILFAI